MESSHLFDPFWWVTAVEMPVLGALFWLIWRTRRDAELADDDIRVKAELGDARLRDSLADFKLEVAKSYASVASLDAVERRLVAHLLRIEHKLDHHLDTAGAAATVSTGEPA